MLAKIFETAKWDQKQLYLDVTYLNFDVMFKKLKYSFTPEKGYYLKLAYELLYPLKRMKLMWLVAHN